MEDVLDYIGAHRDEAVADLRTLLRQPSISAQDIGLEPCAVLSGFGAPENNLHAPNENMPVDRYLQGIAYAAAIMEEYGAEPEK